MTTVRKIAAVRCARIRTMIGIIVEMDDRRTGNARRARRRIVGIMTIAAAGCAAGAPAYGAAPLVKVEHVRITADGAKRAISADVTWNASAARTSNLVDGTVRAVAVDDRQHTPTLLGKELDVHVDAAHPAQHVAVAVADAADVRAMAAGNRVVLTATQHKPAPPTGRTAPTYVTVGQAQPYGSPQPRIGTEDCSGRPVEPGVIDNYCDFVGADFDDAKLSWHDPKGSEGRTESGASRFLRADFTGATLRDAEISGASVAGGRLDGADMSGAKLDNLSLAGAEAVGLIAYGARSDRDAKDSAANVYDADLTGADLRRTQFNGVSFERAVLDGAKLQGATWAGVHADAASFRHADLTDAKVGIGTSLPWADLTDATLTGSDVSDLQMQWTTLCRTKLPKGSVLTPDRDCRGGVEADPIAFPDPDPGRANPYVTISPATITSGGGPRTIHAVVTWDASSRSAAGYGMDAGDVRVLAIDRTTGRPTLITKVAIPRGLPTSTPVDLTVDATREPAKYAAMREGNRIVLTATQHPPAPRAGHFTTRSYVTVSTLQKGPGRGQVGKYDCSRVAIVPGARASGQDYCDLTGATLTSAMLGERSMRRADLTGALLDDGSLTAVTMDGSTLSGVDAQDATWINVGLFAADAPSLDLSDADVHGSRLLAADLTGFRFADGSMDDSSLTGAPLRGAVFTGATLDHPDLAYADLRGGKLDGVTAKNHPSLFLSDLTSATLAGSTWTVDESGEIPWTWATLCHTAMAKDARIDGDRDCPKVPGGESRSRRP